MAFTTAPVNAWWLAWIALVPLWIGVVRLANLKTRQWLWLALGWGIGYHGLVLSWIRGLHPLSWLGIPWLGSVTITLLAWVVITLWGALLVVLWSWGLRTLCVRFAPLRPWLRILVGVTLWCALESLWSLSPLWWTSLSLTQSPHNLAILHLGQLTGPSAITAAIVTVNGGIAEAWMHSQTSSLLPKLATRMRDRAYRWRQFAASLSVVVGFLLSLHLLGFALYNRPLTEPSGTILKVGIIQGNIPTRTKHSEDGLHRAIAHYTNGYQTLADQGVAAVLTPEGAMPLVWNDINRRQSPLYQAVLDKNVTLWLGTFAPHGDQLTQSLLTIDPRGETIGRFHKIKLVPLGEYIPFQEVLSGWINRLSPMQYSLVPGSAEQSFNTPFGQAAVGICYDAVYAGLFRKQVAMGGQFILTASNLDPYGLTLMSQFTAHNVMRAIETDRWLVQATNTGYSSVIDPQGRVQWRSQANIDQIHAATIQRRQTQTPYVRWGDWLTPFLIGLSFCTIMVSPQQFRWRC
jgi:apolipoprotein N-acyltransferase